MRMIEALLILLTASGPASPAGCPATERELLGTWSRSGDSGFFQEFSLETRDGARTFSSWLHQMPEIPEATWSLKNCQLVIVPQHRELEPFKFRIVGLEHGELRLYDESERVESVYVRLPDEA